MAVLVDGAGKTFSNSTFKDAMQMIWLSNKNNKKSLPDNSLLKVKGGFGSGSLDKDGYYQAGWPSFGGQAMAVLTDDGRILLTFTGTNETVDYFAVRNFSNGRYMDGFSNYFDAIAKFAKQNGYKIDLVTGKSLGGAATNILFENRDDVAGGAFADAKYFGMAASYIADNSPNLINFGYDNDYAYRFYQDTFGGLEKGDPSGPEHIVFYNKEYASSKWNPFNDMSSHQYDDVEAGMAAVLSSQFSDIMKQDDLIVVSGVIRGKNEFEIDLQVALDRTKAEGDRTFFISEGNKQDYVKGTKLDDHAILGNGHDKFWGNDGDDVVYGEKGNDALYGGNGNDTLSGGRGRDWLEGGAGNDILTGGNHKDTFVFNGQGDDVITDFNTREDILILDGKTDKNWYETNDGLMCDYKDGGQIFLAGLDMDDLPNINFG